MSEHHTDTVASLWYKHSPGKMLKFISLALALATVGLAQQASVSRIAQSSMVSIHLSPHSRNTPNVVVLVGVSRNMYRDFITHGSSLRSRTHCLCLRHSVHYAQRLYVCAVSPQLGSFN